MISDAVAFEVLLNDDMNPREAMDALQQGEHPVFAGLVPTPQRTVLVLLADAPGGRHPERILPRLPAVSYVVLYEGSMAGSKRLAGWEQVAALVEHRLAVAGAPELVVLKRYDRVNGFFRGVPAITSAAEVAETVRRALDRRGWRVLEAVHADVVRFIDSGRWLKMGALIRAGEREFGFRAYSAEEAMAYAAAHLARAAVHPDDYAPWRVAVAKRVQGR